MKAYYNEFEPYAAEWLDNLAAAGHITGGSVDRRSITEVEPADLAGYERCHFFAGIVGWEYALQLAGWPEDREVWTGSCPCPPFSSAGRKKCPKCEHRGLGFFAGPRSVIEEFGCPACGWRDERNLWPEFLRLIDAGRPDVCFGEQVSSPLGREWLAGVRADLAKLGYVVPAADLCAAGVGAPHIRQRLYWVAVSSGEWSCESSRSRETAEGRQADQEPRAFGELQGGTRGCSGSDRLAHAEPQHDRAGRSGPRGWTESPDGGADGGPGNPCGERPQGWGVLPERGRERAAGPSGVVERLGNSPIDRRDEERQDARGGAEGSRAQGGTDLATGGLVQPDRPGSQPGRQAAAPARHGSTVEPAGGSFWSDFALIPCADGKARRVKPGVFPLADGVPARVGKLRAAGNAIVPQVAADFIRAFMEVA